MFFPLNVVIFLNFTSSAAALVFYLPFSGPSMKSGVHTKGKPREARVWNILKSPRKTQNLMNTLYLCIDLVLLAVPVNVAADLDRRDAALPVGADQLVVG